MEEKIYIVIGQNFAGQTWYEGRWGEHWDTLSDGCAMTKDEAERVLEDCLKDKYTKKFGHEYWIEEL